MWCKKLLKGAALFVAFGFSAALAQSYSLSINYSGDELYYKVGNGACTKATGANGKFTATFTNVQQNANISLFSQQGCTTGQLQSAKVTNVFKNGATTATIELKAPPAGGQQPGEQPGGAPTVSSSSSKPVASSSSRNNGGWGGGNIGGGAAKPTGKTVIRFLTPWTNTSAVLFVDGNETATMTKVKNYCGWFEASLNPPTTGFNVHFKQTIGLNYVGAEGMVQKEPTSATEISLDSIAALTDTIWIQGYKNDVPAIFAKYPGVLGECPLKKFPVTVFDWLHGDKGDGANGNGASTNGVSADFGSGGCSASPMKGMVKPQLGSNGVPVPADPFPTNCKLTDHLANWFLPEVIAKKNGVEYTNMTCRDLYISMDNEGFWLAEVSSNKISEGNEKNKGGMFLVDDFEYLDEAQTIKNPYYDHLNGSGGYHNFGFAVKIQATFEYIPGQYFDFYGDDDVWVFIDNRLAVDIGGQHGQVAGAVDLDTMGLKVGETYNFHIFYVERHVSSSNFRMRTSIDLQVDASIFVTSDKKGTATNYDIWQINKKNKLSCGYDPNNTEVDTTGGASTFRLTGGSLDEPMILSVGKHFEGGIIITSDSTFSIDSALIVDNKVLAPGHYFLEIALKSDPSQTTIIEIVIPSYPLPSVAFADESWKILGKEVTGNKATIGSWAYEVYPVNITFFRENDKDKIEVNKYNQTINLSTSSPLIDIVDKDGNAISKVNMTMVNGEARATFYIRANGYIPSATIIAKGTAAAPSYWKELVFEEPPVPRVEVATLYDRNGDGRGDRLYVKFNKSLKGDSKLDSLQLTFGETFAVVNSKNIKIISDTEIEVVSAASCDSGSVCGFGTRQFTGGESSIYTGNMSTWFTYTESGKNHNLKITNEPVDDGMGPIIVKATKESMRDGNRKLTITFSEAISDESRQNLFQTMFEYICYRSGEQKQPEAPVRQGGSGKTITMVFSPSTLDAVFPTDGDQVRFVPGENMAEDLLGNVPHKYNPWVIIIGDQELTNQSPGLIDIGEDPYGIIAKKDETTQPFLITDTKKDAQMVGNDMGVQGNLVDFDISKIMAEQTMKDIEKLDNYVAKLTGASKADTTYEYTQKSAEEVTQELFADIMTGEFSAGLDETTIEKIRNGEITKDNYKKQIKNEELETIEELIKVGVENSKDSTPIPPSALITGYDDIFEKIASGEIKEADLKKAGVSEELIQAIRDGVLTSTNIDNYRSGSESLVGENSVVMHYRTLYYDHLGNYVGGHSDKISCSDNVYGAEGCLNNKGKLFLAWNMRDDKGRLVGTGAYIARLEVKVKVNGKTVLEQTRDKLWGVRRGKN